MTDGSPRVAVVGLGAVGSMAVWQLARCGAAVTGFERSVPGHDDAAYGGHTRQFRLCTHDRHDRIHLPLARRSLELWRELEAATEEHIYLQTGQLAIGPTRDADIATLQANLERSGLSHDVLESDEVMQRFPVHRLTSDEVGILVEDAGVLRSNRGVAAAVRAAADAGAEIVADAAVTAVETTADGGVVVTVGGRTHSYDHVVVTTGPWVAELLPTLRDTVTARAIVTGWHRPMPRALVDPRHFPPGFRRAVAPHGGLTFLPALDGRGVKIIHWMPIRPEVADTTDWECAIPRDARDGGPAVAAAFVGVEHEPSELRVYLEGFTRDRFPVLCRPTPNVTVLSGFSGMGFAVAPAVGEIAANLALAKDPNFDLTTLDPARFVTAMKAGCA